MTSHLSRLNWLEAEAIHILREGFAESRVPVMLFSAGKDSTVLAHLTLRASHLAPPPLPLLHVESNWKSCLLLAFRNDCAREHGFRLIVYANEEGRAAGLNPFDHGDYYTTAMRTGALREALDQGGYDTTFGGARCDEERSLAKKRVFSVRSAGHGWDPRQQQSELWRLYNARIGEGQSIRVFPCRTGPKRTSGATLSIVRSISRPSTLRRPGRLSSGTARSSSSTIPTGCRRALASACRSDRSASALGGAGR